jgi:hypothetical protein
MPARRRNTMRARGFLCWESCSSSCSAKMNRLLCNPKGRSRWRWSDRASVPDLSQHVHPDSSWRKRWGWRSVKLEHFDQDDDLDSCCRTQPQVCVTEQLWIRFTQANFENDSRVRSTFLVQCCWVSSSRMRQSTWCPRAIGFLMKEWGVVGTIAFQ